MGFLDKVMFWKKKDDFPSLDDFDKDIGMHGSHGFDEPKVPGEHLSGMEEHKLPGLDDHAAAGLAPPMPMHEPAGPQVLPRQPGYQPGAAPSFAPQQQQPAYGVGHPDIELLKAKMDALKAVLDSINQRLANLERIAREDL